MKISHGTRIKQMNPANGYGYATERVLASLRELSHEVNQNDPDAPVQIWFDQPPFWKWNKSTQYRIGYHPWESTKLRPGWVQHMNQCDEIWTPSPLIASWYKQAGVRPPVYTYQHGVDKIWTPRERKVGDTMKFMHMGAESARKGGFQLLRTFRKAFPENNDIGLTLKMINPGWNLPMVGRVNVINRTMKIDQLVDLFHEHHVYVYPSWGEGFGLTPLQAMATGMPVITLPAWAPYAHHLDPNLSVKSKLHGSQWPTMHPGKMFAPSEEDLIEKLLWVYNNYEQAHAYAQAQIPKIVKEYDWVRLTDEAFTNLEERLKNR